jgi:hypothetical protein
MAICWLLMPCKDKLNPLDYNHQMTVLSSDNSPTNPIEKWVNKSLDFNSIRKLQNNVNDDRNL